MWRSSRGWRETSISRVIPRRIADPRKPSQSDGMIPNTHTSPSPRSYSHENSRTQAEFYGLLAPWEGWVQELHPSPAHPNVRPPIAAGDLPGREDDEDTQGERLG